MACREHLPIYKAALDLTAHFEKLVTGSRRAFVHAALPTLRMATAKVGKGS